MTSPRIAILPPALADQIAAGEVVERAASVAKELCENAIDAGARRIEVDIEGGGRRLVRVVDDGTGMTPEEARLALRRHATSKLRNADDLWRLATFGFRGEALPSIAAVSRLTLATKPPDADAGFQLTVEAGTETEARQVGIPVGTQIEVRDLFFNTPARQKFQKTETTEAANVTEAVLRLALAHPEVHFRLRAAGRTVLDLPTHQRLGERVRAALARRGAGALHEAIGDEGGHRVQVFLAAPEEASATARSTFLFVGRRFIRDRPLLQALSLGYGDLLERGRYPLAALFLDVPGDELDVNVHPQKMEVRFSRPTEVHAAVRHVVAAGIARAPWLLPRGSATPGHTLPPRPPRAGEASDDRGVYGGSTVSFAGAGAARWEPTEGGDGRRRGLSANIHASGDTPERGFPHDGFSSEGRAREGNSDAGLHGALQNRMRGVTALASASVDAVFIRSLSYIGQLQRTYLLCERAGELVLIDQHGASELAAAAGLRAAWDGRALKPHRLLFPVPIQVASDQTSLSGGELAIMKRLGFDLLAEVSSGSLILQALPEPLKDADPKPLVQEVVRILGARRAVSSASGDLRADGPRNAEVSAIDNSNVGDAEADLYDDVLAAMACHAAARAGDILARPQVLALLARLADEGSEWSLPHGRPLAARISVADLEREFGQARDDTKT